MKSTRIGIAGFVVLVLAFAMSAGNYANGIHCVGCDRPAQLEFWTGYFMVKDATYALAALLLLVAIPFAKPRRWPFAFGFALAVFAWALTPM